jgi:muramoyltetrapeptide carboxypeptidase
MHLTIPPALQKGDLIAIVATARWIEEEPLQSAISLIESWGFRVKSGAHVQTRNFQLAGTDDQRANDLQKAILDPDVKAILIARGGYGTIRILDQVDFTPLIRDPKWICGYSDITVLHAKLNNMGIASIHSTMPVSFGDATDKALENLKDCLTGSLKEVVFRGEVALGQKDLNIDGVSSGGNLSVLYSMLGSSEMRHSPGRILFLEDVDEMVYHIDRMLMGLKRSGYLNETKAVVLGGFTQMKDNTKEFSFKTDNPWGKSAQAVVFDICSQQDIPVFSGFPAGHFSDNRAFYLGVPASISSDGIEHRLTFQHGGHDK